MTGNEFRAERTAEKMEARGFWNHATAEGFKKRAEKFSDEEFKFWENEASSDCNEQEWDSGTGSFSR